MIPKLFKSGKSFKKLAAYLLHDAGKAKTSERVRWTHTLNLVSDHPAGAVDEMLWVYRAQDALKREAGLKAGGRQLENPVKHFSLNWHPSEKPTPEHMIETVESFLVHMKWQEHQALIVCHEDKKHPHVHVMLCAVHPETGRALDTSFEKRRAQEWAKAYEREHQLVFCEERLLSPEQRTPSPTRATWEQLRAYEREDDRAVMKEMDYFDRNDEKAAHAREWKVLKEAQRQEREAFFAGGKEAYRQVRNQAYREVREEFRGRWREYYECKREGMGPQALADMKTDILASQEVALETRREELSAELRRERDVLYQERLNFQMLGRLDLRENQQEGRPSYFMLDALYPAENKQERAEPSREAFREAAEEAGEPEDREREQEQREEDEQDLAAPDESRSFAPVRDPIGVAEGFASGGLSALAALASIGERLFDGFMGMRESPAPRRQQAGRDRADTERESRMRAVALQAKSQEREEEAAKLKEWWDERRERRRERD